MSDERVIPQSNYLNLNPGSEHALKQVRQWADQCFHHHPRCKNGAFYRRKTHHQWPSRLIKVGSTSNDEVRLCEFEEYSKIQNRNISYAALSYCWGDQEKYPNFSTTTNNISRLHQNIQVAKLPVTVQEAIIITRLMGIPYIWVDAICINYPNLPTG